MLFKKTVTFSHYDLNDTGIGVAKIQDLKKMEQCLTVSTPTF